MEKQSKIDVIMTWLNSKFSGDETTNEVKMEGDEETLSPFYFNVKEYDKFNLYIKLENKCITFYVKDSFIDDCFANFKNINSTSKNKDILKSMLTLLFSSSRADIVETLKYSNNSIVVDNVKFKVFLEPVSLYRCETDIFIISDIVFKNFTTLLNGLDKINVELKEHNETSKKLNELRDSVLTRVLNKYRSKRDVIKD